MPKKHRIAIYSYLFKEGVLSCQKDVKKPTHHEMDLPNLHVVKAMLSLKSRGYVREVFNWQWHYFFLTDAGIQYLKEYLHLPEDVVPATMKRGPNDATGESSVAAMGGAFGGRDGRPGRFGDRGDRPRTGAPRA